MMIKDLSDGLAGLGRRRSAQDIPCTAAKQKNSRSRKTRANKSIGVSSKQSCSELDLVQTLPDSSVRAISSSAMSSKREG
ncbi:hypothetical protein EC973_004139 [Apophysomyces ossiformis]|uniref:Uncharacterized protein n=1 Tax=Apophysomyces ossiformis TaxID=679940 RepID=A0A8H7BIM6_9FUNG|nr:hypothetical protein EC973_004139 [Apophysomyces ossiformis]